MEPLLFTNFSDEDFVGRYDGKDTKIKAGQAIYFEDHLVAHFGKHLCDREMRKMGKRIVDEPYKTQTIKKVHPALEWVPGKHQVRVNKEIVEQMKDPDDELKDLDPKTRLINKNKTPKKVDPLVKARAAKAAKKAQKEAEEEFEDLEN